MTVALTYVDGAVSLDVDHYRGVCINDKMTAFIDRELGDHHTRLVSASHASSVALSREEAVTLAQTILKTYGEVA